MRVAIPAPGGTSVTLRQRASQRRVGRSPDAGDHLRDCCGGLARDANPSLLDEGGAAGKKTAARRRSSSMAAEDRALPHNQLLCIPCESKCFTESIRRVVPSNRLLDTKDTAHPSKKEAQCAGKLC